MRFLHTSDWHLGIRLYGMDRKEEHAHFLKWLLEQIKTLQVDVLLITGDVFDTSNPPQDALQMYYEFLANVAKIQNCKSVIIIGGNHDSASLLNAPRDILKTLNIHVIGCTTGKIEDEIILLGNSENDFTAAICAVPFLRDKDLRYFVAGESYEEKSERLKQAIAAHYQKINEYIQNLPSRPPIVIATGHLFAVGSQTSESEKMIHVGNLGQVETYHFPDTFKYIALGHIHKPQKVGNTEHIRYAGSPIPLSFTELDIEKHIVVVDIEPHSDAILNFIPIPPYRQLMRIRGSLAEIKQVLSTLHQSSEKPTLWIEITVILDKKELQVTQQVKEMVKNENIIILAVKVEKQYVEQGIEDTMDFHVDLATITPHQVFMKRCENIDPKEQESLRITFDEVLSLLRE
ncbi:MAG: exonuclease SbcCD subunit D C-terminal domain-containing protein [Bacteroidia bacterium]|nr:exonuclease SbcCD subunit D C-terminal domain-containing protein [Bacteroidia bacterium]